MFIYDIDENGKIFGHESATTGGHYVGAYLYEFTTQDGPEEIITMEKLYGEGKELKKYIMVRVSEKVKIHESMPDFKEHYNEALGCHVSSSNQYRELCKANKCHMSEPGEGKEIRQRGKKLQKERIERIRKENYSTEKASHKAAINAVASQLEAKL